jgi:hypothetical protein
MIREGQPEVTLRYIADAPKRMAISTFAEGMHLCIEEGKEQNLTMSSPDAGPQHTKIL